MGLHSRWGVLQTCHFFLRQDSWETCLLLYVESSKTSLAADSVSCGRTWSPCKTKDIPAFHLHIEGHNSLKRWPHPTGHWKLQYCQKKPDPFNAAKAPCQHRSWDTSRQAPDTVRPAPPTTAASLTRSFLASGTKNEGEVKSSNKAGKFIERHVHGFNKIFLTPKQFFNGEVVALNVLWNLL